jgi:hypothetical protein
MGRPQAWDSDLDDRPRRRRRAMLGLWGDNPDLLAALPPSSRHPDSASSFLLVECWRRLRAER